MGFKIVRGWKRMLIRILDGLNTVGGTKILLEAGSARILLDFGYNYARAMKFFDGFLQPRSARPLTDRIVLSLLPNIPGLYRDDLEDMEDQREVPQNRPAADLCFLSHAHHDHCGMVPFLHERIPILASPETATFMALFDILSREEGFLAIHRRRREVTRYGRNVSSFRHSGAWHPRKTFLTSAASLNGLCSFLLAARGNTSSEGVIKTVCRALDRAELWPGNLKDVKIEPLPVYHSIVGATCVRVTSGEKAVVYTGDLRGSLREEVEALPNDFRELLEGYSNRSEKTLEILAETEPDLLIIEGTRAGEKKTTTEVDVYRNLKDVFRKWKDSLIVACFPVKHAERMLIFLRLAFEFNRKLVLFPRDALIPFALSMAGERVWAKIKDFMGDQMAIFIPAKVHFSKLEQALIKGNSNGNLLPEDINKKPTKYVLCADLYDMPELIDIRDALKGAVFVYSSSEFYTEEQKLDGRRLVNWLKFFGMHIEGLEVSPSGDIRTTGLYHASGHISGDGIERIVRKLKPKKILPVHTTPDGLKWFRERFGDRVVCTGSTEGPLELEA